MNRLTCLTAGVLWLVCVQAVPEAAIADDGVEAPAASSEQAASEKAQKLDADDAATYEAVINVRKERREGASCPANETLVCAVDRPLSSERRTASDPSCRCLARPSFF